MHQLGNPSAFVLHVLHLLKGGSKQSSIDKAFSGEIQKGENKMMRILFL